MPDDKPPTVKAADPESPDAASRRELLAAAEKAGVPLPRGKEQTTTDQLRRALEMHALGMTAEAIEMDQAVIDEWSKWVAVQAIDYQGTRAYNPGDKVPDSNVQAHNYALLGWVAPADSEQAQIALASRTGGSR